MIAGIMARVRGPRPGERPAERALRQASDGSRPAARALTDLFAVVSVVALAWMVFALVDFSNELVQVIDSADRWQLDEVFPVSLVFAAALSWYAWRRVGESRRALAERHHLEAEERAIAAIGLGANWDLKLAHVYARLAADLRTLLDFDRMVVTAPLLDGRAEVVFVHGDHIEDQQTGAVLSANTNEPDGLVNPEAFGYMSRIAIPVGAAAASPGWLTLRRKRAAGFTPRDADLLRRVAVHAASAIANARLFETTQRQVRERSALAEISRVVIEAKNIDTTFRNMSEALKGLIAFDRLEIALVEDDGKTCSLAYAHGVNLLEDDDGPRTSGADRRQPPHLPQIYGGLRSSLQIPLMLRNGVIGFITLWRNSQAEYGEEERLLLRQVAAQIAPAIESARLYAEAQREAAERTLMAEIGLAVNLDLNLNTIYERVADGLKKLLTYDRLVVTETDPATGDLRIVFMRGVAVEGSEVGAIRPPATREPHDRADGRVRILRTGASSEPPPTPDIAAAGLRSWAQVEIGAPGLPFGYLSIRSLQENAYRDRDLDLMERVAAQIAPAIENARLLAKERELNARLDEQNQQLQAADEAKTRFLSTVSHELKTPLTVVAGFIDILAGNSDGNLTPDQQDTLAIMYRNAHRLGLLINDLLDFSRMEVGGFKLDKREFDVRVLLQELSESFAPILEDRSQTLDAHWPDDAIWIEADRDRLAQVVMNLLSNASKFSPTGSIITLRSQVARKRLVVRIEDRGIGISTEDQGKLFTSFFRADTVETRSVPGTGLGLVIAKSIIEMHGGRIKITSSPGAGTTVEFHLPGAMPRPSESYLAAQQRPNLAFQPRSRLYPDAESNRLPFSAA